MQVVLKVEHDGDAKMVGKVFEVMNGPDLIPIFLHEQLKRSQRHIKLDSPGGVDAVVIDWLIAQRVHYVHHHVRHGSLWEVEPEVIRDLGVSQRSGGRNRVYLAYQHWNERPGGAWYQVPWVTDEIVVAVPADPQQALPGTP